MLTERLGLPARCAACSPASPSAGTARASPACAGRGDPARRADRARRPRRHVPAHARRRGARGRASSASGPGRRLRSGGRDALADDAGEILALETSARRGRRRSPASRRRALMLEGDAIDRALAAMGDFADLVSPYLVGPLGRRGASWRQARRERCGLDAAELVTSAARRSSTTSGGSRSRPRIWQKPGPLTPDEWEQVRLHAYHSERVLAPLAVPGRARAGRHGPPRAPRRLGLPPRRRRRRRSRRRRACSPPPTPTTR